MIYLIKQCIPHWIKFIDIIFFYLTNVYMVRPAKKEKSVKKRCVKKEVNKCKTGGRPPKKPNSRCVKKQAYKCKTGGRPPLEKPKPKAKKVKKEVKPTRSEIKEDLVELGREPTKKEMKKFNNELAKYFGIEL